MEKESISSISDIECTSVDLIRHSTIIFTDIIKENLLPNQKF